MKNLSWILIAFVVGLIIPMGWQKMSEVAKLSGGPGPGVSAEGPSSAVQSYPRGTKLSTPLIKALVDLGAVAKREEGSETWRVRDLTCAFAPGEDEPTVVCEFKDEVSGKTVNQTGEAAEVMRNLLFGFPVSQGEPGASTPWLECFRGGGFDSCTLGILVDYDGP